MRLIAIIASLSLVVLAACTNDEPSTPSEITGVVTEVDAAGLTDVESFAVRAGDKTYEILIDSDTDLGFPPAHLNEHRVSGEPVRVEVDEREGDLYAVSVEDA